uniref:legumain n=1 Tax=Strigamia maritima TaxID=126957 RepID=T1JMC8_STRMM
MYRKVVNLLFCFLMVKTLVAFDLNHLNDGGKIWALLVAGSNGYYNYRHQADVCHAYHVLNSHGIPDERIVVMMYDDIAQHSLNPTKGVIINHPDGHNVYKGVLKDYTKLDVTPKNFLNVLQGKSDEMKNIGSGKVIKSGPKDHIFVYFADHGAIGLVSFPNQVLYARELNAAIKNMYQQKKFSKMVMYVEACESGSMFDKLLPDNINVFVTTAANPIESSFACYWDDLRQAYLGDLYSVTWMEDSDKEILTKETLKKQFEIVKKQTNASHVQEYGDLTIANMKISEFQGEKQSSGLETFEIPLDAIPSHQVPLITLKRKLQMTNSFEEMENTENELIKLLRNRDYLLDKVESIVTRATFTAQQVDTILSQRFELFNFDCYEQTVKYFSENCFSISANAYAMRYLHVFVNMCETGISADKQIKAMSVVCIHPPIHGIL